VLISPASYRTLLLFVYPHVRTPLMSTIAFDLGTVNFALCCSQNHLVTLSEVFRIGDSKDPIAVLIRGMICALDARLQTLGPIAKVYIEQQLGMRASKNTSLSSALFAYCICTFRDATVEFVSPRNKFKLLAAMHDRGIAGISERSEEFKSCRGPALKKLSVQASKALATHYGDCRFVTALAELKKQDDKSDSYLDSVLRS
jgi:hypothetical protein